MQQRETRDAAAELSDVDLAFQGWHRLLRFLLVLDAVALGLFAFFREVDTIELLGFVAVPLALVGAASLVGSDRFRSALVAIGFSWCSWLIVVWSGGAIEAHFHGLVVIGLVALYQDGPPVVLVAVGQILLHGLGLVDPPLVYNHQAAIDAPAVWGFIHVIAILGAVSVPVFVWRGSRDRAQAYASRASSKAFAVADARRRKELAQVYATVARRSQSLLERQIGVIEELQQHEQDPDSLQRLFTLDHLATRMNREATSMLVLAGGEPSRRVTGNPPLSEVVRAAVGEIESYTRVDVRLEDDRSVTGPVVAALVHLLSELVENATMYSAPSTRVDVIGGSTTDGGYELLVRDRGIGLDEQKLEQYNTLLSEGSNTATVDTQRLGFEVVGRLADRYDITVTLDHNISQRGVNATIGIPAALLLRAEVSAGQASSTALGAPPAQLTSSTPRWAQATARAGQGDGVATPSRTAAEPETPAPAATTAPTPVAPAPAAQSGQPSWSYGGHLKPQEPTPEPVAKRGFGRGSRSQVTGLSVAETDDAAGSLDAPVSWAVSQEPGQVPTEPPITPDGGAPPPDGDTPQRDADVAAEEPEAARVGGLPKRSPGASLPTQLQTPTSGMPARSSSSAPVSREESRSLLSSYQSRLQAGRKAAEDQISDENDSS
ncbi:ATP-binding protein [Euzebya tangerina]|uniref:ATP-binding protein n=1 Tax=Euzebya tangerina TaxID=591198 RepID=UPI000E322ABD|nr:ATP-binding protein [Euzebya tangerina]